MITIICIKNPFAPYEGREIHKIAYQAEKPVSWYIDPYLSQYVPLDKLVIAVNSHEVTGDDIVKNGDFVVISPYIGKGSKNPLLLVASVALSVASMGLGATVAGVSGVAGGLGAATGWAAIGGYLTAAAVMYLGGTLINRVFGTTKENSTSNPTYSWDGITTTSGQGNAIPITYGTVKTGGQALNKFVMIHDNDQYLYWLLCGGEGYCAISDVQINENPVGYYENVSCDIRNGVYNQSVISNFNDTVSTVSLSEELLATDWRTYALTGNANQGIIIQVECSNGLYYAKDNGNLDSEWVSIKAQYCVTGTTNWVTFVDEKISAAQASAVHKQYRVDNLSAGSYTVRVMVTGRGADVGSTRAQTRIWWTSVSGIVYDDFSYPGMCLVGIKGLATNQLSGSPSITFIKKRTTILAYHPDTQVYETKDATNPAWAAYDMLHRAIDINGDQSEIVVTGVPADLILYDRFAAWAAFCDSKNLKINIEINTAEKMMESINKNIAAVGYGIVLMFGVKFGCVWDAVVDTPVQMFGMGNIIAGTFEEKFLQTSDRANAVEVTFTNKDKNYERDTVTVYADDYDDADAYNKSTSITMDGITSYEQAYQYGKFQLYCNKYLIRTCVFDAAIDAIACNAGDVIAVSHDVPEWACSGRITAVNGSQVTVGALFDNYDSTASYQFQYRASVSDNIHVVPISDMVIHDTGVTVTLSSVPSDAPAVGDVCDIAKTTIGSKLFTVKTITRSNDGEFKRTITCLEYNKNVFSENYDIPTPNYSTAQPGQAQNVYNLTGSQINWLDSNGIYHATIYLSWEYPDIVYQRFNLFISEDGEQFASIGSTTAMRYEYETTPGKSYVVKVITIAGASVSSGITFTVAKGDNDIPDGTLQNLTAHTRYRGLQDGTPRYDIVVQWEPDELSGNVYYKSNHAQSEGTIIEEGVSADTIGYLGGWTLSGTGVNQLIIPQAIPGDTYRIAVATKDVTGEYISPDDAPYIDLLIELKTTVPNTPEGFAIHFGATVIASWNEVTNTDIAYYELRTDNRPGENTNGFLAQTTGIQTTLPLTARAGTVYLFALNTSGKYSYPVTLTYNVPKPDAPTLTASALLKGINLKIGTFPANVNSVDIYFVGEGYSNMVNTKNTVYTFSGDPNIYDISAAYVDVFGEGYESQPISITIDPTIDPDWIAAESVTLEKVDRGIQTAVANANTAVTRLDDVDTSIVGINQSIVDINQTTNSITQTVANNKTAQDTVNSTVSTDIAQIKQTADSLASIVQSNKTTQDTTNSNVEADISQIQQTATSLASTVQTNKITQDTTNAALSNKISQVSQTASDISSTVQANKTAQDGTNSSLSSQIDQTATSISNVVSNLNKSDPSQTGYSAIAQLSDDVALRVSKNDVINQINVSDEGIRIDGSKFHVTGDTLFDNNVVVEGMIKAGAITADKLSAEDITLGSGTATGIVGGVVRLDSDGLKVSCNDNTFVKYNGEGMGFYDSNGNRFSGIGRFCTGVASDGQYVKFNNAWDIVPSVFLFPTSLQTSSSEYSATNIYQQVIATNITKNGFTVICRSIIQAGSGSNISLNNQFAQWDGAVKNSGGTIYSKTVSVPTSATSFTGNISVVGSTRYSQGSGGGNNGSGAPDMWGKTSIDVQWLVNGNVVQAFYQVMSVGGGASNGYNVTKSISLSNATNVTVQVRFRGGYTSNWSGVNGDNMSTPDLCYGNAVFNSYSVDTSQDTVIATGKAGFIAVDANAVPYTLQ